MKITQEKLIEVLEDAEKFNSIRRSSRESTVNNYILGKVSTMVKMLHGIGFDAVPYNVDSYKYTSFVLPKSKRFKYVYIAGDDTICFEFSDGYAEIMTYEMGIVYNEYEVEDYIILQLWEDFYKQFIDYCTISLDKKYWKSRRNTSSYFQCNLDNFTKVLEKGWVKQQEKFKTILKMFLNDKDKEIVIDQKFVQKYINSDEANYDMIIALYHSLKHLV